MSGDLIQKEGYLVLDAVSRDLFARTMSELGFSKHNVWEPAGPRGVYEEVWTNKAQTLAVHYVEDPVLSMSFIWVRGSNIDPLVSELANEISLFYPEELIERAYITKDHNEQVDNLYRLAITFPKYDPQVYEIFKRYATEPPNQLLRQAALNAMAYRAWPELRAVVETATKEDESDEVRQTATELLPVWKDDGA